LHNNSRRVLVTGGAGFIGSHLVDELLRGGYKTLVIDNLSTGRLKNVPHAPPQQLVFRKLDLTERSPLLDVTRDVQIVYHFAADPDVRMSTVSPETHLRENIVATFNLVEALRLNDFGGLFVFASTAAVYGDVTELPVSEDYGPARPVSVYGASKLACEDLLFTYGKLYGFRVASLRFANVIGPRSRHGLIFDFIKKLQASAGVLEILGDGEQTRSYVHVDDAVRAITTVTQLLNDSKDLVFNVGNTDWITVKTVAEIVCRQMGIAGCRFVAKPATNDGRGWLGDMKNMSLDITRLTGHGWRPIRTSGQAVRDTANSLIQELKAQDP
jgi:UDP-glucose 4-epimerase